MGQDLSYRSGDDVYEWRVSKSDWDALEAIRALHSVDVETLFDVPERIHASQITKSVT